MGPKRRVGSHPPRPNMLGVMSAGEVPPGYPSHRIADVVLRDGTTVRMRPVLPQDVHGIVELFTRLSEKSLRFRFHGSFRVSEKEVKRFVEVDYRGEVGLVAETSLGGRQRTIGLASYFEIDPDRAEMAVAVDDVWHGRGVGSILVEHLAEAASEAGISTFVAYVLHSNAKMLDVIHSLHVPVHTSFSSGVVTVEFPTSPTLQGVEAFEAREAIAAAAAVKEFLEPRSVAVVGASRRRNTIGGEVLKNLFGAGFEGPVYPVNPKAPVVQSVTAYAKVTDIPGPVDLAVIVVPASQVQSVALDCGEKGVRALVVISAGFSETGEEGARRQAELLELARRYGMRIVGPNCMGILNTDPRVRLNATFSPITPPAGRLAFSSQSGALGIAVMHRAQQIGLGISSFISVGNKADISGNDLLQYWEQDENTDVILLYLESFGNPRKFARLSRRISKDKPIVAVKSGRSRAGARAAASHTGSIVAGDVAVDALFRQAGVIRTDTLEELFDVANLLAHQPLPAGDRVGILTNAGGLGILCADACEAAGLLVPELAEKTSTALRSILPVEAGVGNPVDMIASASAGQYEQALGILAADEGLDSIVVIFIPPLVTRAEDVADALVRAASTMKDKTVLCCFLGGRQTHERLRSDDVVLPSFSFPESAARALGKVASHARWRARPEGSTAAPSGIDRATAFRLAADSVARGPGWLDPPAVTRLLDCYGVPSAASRLVKSPEEVGKAAAGIGRPVAVKINSTSLLHKTDVGGVRLDLTSPDAAASAARDMLERLTEEGLADQLDGFLVQEMVSESGAEMFVGMTHDPLFGPLLACGAGGTLVELIRDVSVRITPLSDLDASDMIRSLKTYPLLEGYRGGPVLDAGALEDVLLRVSVMVEDLPHLVELDLNPVLVLPDGGGCRVLDARIRIAPPAPSAPRGARPTP
ncbi:GNAT family N-acetyltransferase [soil metagenome]